MTITNIHDAKTHLSRLLKEVDEGKEVIIGRFGKPIAKIIPYKTIKKPRIPGSCKGKIHIKKDFDTLPSEVIDSFYN